jgi:hypothetical protein
MTTMRSSAAFGTGSACSPTRAVKVPAGIGASQVSTALDGGVCAWPVRAGMLDKGTRTRIGIRLPSTCSGGQAEAAVMTRAVAWPFSPITTKEASVEAGTGT